MRFEGKVAIVTGSSTGIGEATALAFGWEGADVVLAARSMGKLKIEGDITLSADLLERLLAKLGGKKP
jgi:NAD(P)-dependent dehydrogenase (short-subunit alcohol dehydrogenase family)